MSAKDDFPELPPHLRLLKTLVTVLTGVMILGVIVVVGLLVTRFPTPVTAPEALQLPEGTVAQAVTQGHGWWIVVTEDARVLFFGSDGALRQEVPLDSQ
ncbi:hypothetical protein PM03_07030 [Thalassobacter stenotrophicus]|uniref:DUF6476 family protein n=1 Tax=Thalassobacter TaxID=266808 RepID=UPI00051DEDFE|nr:MULTISPECIES: DUF6476 family protein [Thalassobacter]KGK79259.1 hypothetical protein PM03_07030 [Thalassobacter stenotrophicus]KGL00529.1 hypothetical protein PM04_14160 [Thalassobacter sp. 16PALIMAR09]